MRLNGKFSIESYFTENLDRPWIVNASVKDNILFGKEYDEARYRRTVIACSLVEDFSLMKSSDQTIIGERGINLSGGQKARIALARAVYSDSSIVLLDDPLAAVDPHVGQHIFSQCIHGDLLDGKSVILVTNHAQLLSAMDRILVVQDKTIVFDGTFNDLLKAGENLRSLVVNDDENDEESETFDLNKQETEARKQHIKGQKYFEELDGDNEEDVLYNEEDMQVGRVKFTVYRYYARNVGYCLAISALTVQFLYLLTPLAGQYILSFWSNEVACEINNLTVAGDTSICNNLQGEEFWFSLYISSFFIGLIGCIIAGVLIAESRVTAVRRIHSKLVEAIFHAPISFFDVTPVGRILNRFSKDMNLADIQLTMMLM